MRALADADGRVYLTGGASAVRRERSVFIAREGGLAFHHFDFYSQVLAKIERWHAQDRDDVAAFLGRGLVDAPRLRELFEQIVPQLYHYPALDEHAFRANLDAALSGHGSD